MGNSRTGRVIRAIAVLSSLSLMMTACDADEVLKLLNARVVGQDLPAATSADLAAAMDRGTAEDADGTPAGGEPDATPPSAAPQDTAPEDTAPEDTAPEDTAPEDAAPDDPAPEDPAVTDDGRSSETAVSSLERQIFDLLNDTRLQAGQDALTRRAGMSEGAREWSCEMSRTGEFHHANLRAVGVNGENIAWGQQSAAEVHEDWMNSPGHRDNRMNARWTEYGVGVCTNASGLLHYTERFR